MDILTVCPHLVCQNAERTHFLGLLSVKGETFRVSFRLAAPGRVKGAVIDCDWKLNNLLQGYNDILKKRLDQCTTLEDFLVELKSLVERLLEQCHRVSLPPPVQYYNDLVKQIEELGWQQLVYADANFQELHLQATDENNRSHILKVILDSKHPAEAPKCVVDLPVPFTPVWGVKKNTLQDLYSQFISCISQFQDFWDMLDQLDANTWILEPENPSRGATSRRIAIGSSASIQLDVDPAHPRALPECRFLGADHVVNPLKENLNKNLDKWQSSGSLYSNLQIVLDIVFPSPDNTKKEDFNIECSICYSHRLADKIPDQVCGDPRCEAQYHQACLYEWLRALPSCRQSFNTLFGECPYCSRAITVKMPV